jgi:hypothetical protein
VGVAAAVTAREQCKERLDHPGSVGATEAGQVVEDVLRNLEREVATRMVVVLAVVFFFVRPTKWNFGVLLRSGLSGDHEAP